MGNSGSNSLSDSDSTWEGEECCEVMAKVSMQLPWSAQRDANAARDMQNYRYMWRITQSDDVPDDELDNDKVWPNLQFYQNKIPFSPDGICIDEFHLHWFGDYDKLEHVHCYIQWLFPTHEKAVNTFDELSPEVFKLFCRDKEVMKRLLTSYKLMLDFYGIELISEETGEVKRAVNWKERFANLNRNSHNNHRITRILKSMGLMGFPHYQAPLVQFFLVETLVTGTLPQVKQSALDYFIFAVVDKAKRRELIKFALLYFEPKEKFVWCPKEIKNQFLKEVKQAQEECLGNAK
ncbi:opioid growth factor receptor-like protein 1 [Hemibagrus wyckioides]|nr:opioid growth factor receptor-like protein 1 [Hemibagrus wyckioides]